MAQYLAAQVGDIREDVGEQAGGGGRAHFRKCQARKCRARRRLRHQRGEAAVRSYEAVGTCAAGLHSRGTAAAAAHLMQPTAITRRLPALRGDPRARIQTCLLLNAKSALLSEMRGSIAPRAGFWVK